MTALPKKPPKKTAKELQVEGYFRGRRKIQTAVRRRDGLKEAVEYIQTVIETEKLQDEIFLYRFEDKKDDYGSVYSTLIAYRVYYQTKCKSMIYFKDREKLFLNTTLRRFVFKSPEEALHEYVSRKHNQLRIIRRQADEVIQRLKRFEFETDSNLDNCLEEMDFYLPGDIEES